MEGPVRSISRMPTEWPSRDRERASWVVTEDLPTPPLPERIFYPLLAFWVAEGGMCGERSPVREECS